MEISKHFVKKSMQECIEESNLYVNYILESDVFIPKIIVNSIYNDDILRLLKYLRSENHIKSIKAKILEPIIEEDLETVDVNLYKSLVNYSVERRRRYNRVFSNLDNHKSKKHKVNFRNLSNIISLIPKSKRTLKSISNRYNNSIFNKMLSIETIRVNMRKKMLFKNVKADPKGKTFFNDNNLNMDIIFLYRLINDIYSNYEICFFDESGFRSRIDKRKIWISKYEDNRIPKLKTFLRLNMLMLTNFTQILKVQVNDINTTHQVVINFLKK